MPDSHNLAVDPASPDAHVEEHFFKQGVDQEGQAHDGHFEDLRGRKSRSLVVAGAALGGAACFIAAVVLLLAPPAETAAPVAAAPVAPAPVAAPPVNPAPVAAVPTPPAPAPVAEAPAASPAPLVAGIVPTTTVPATAVPATPAPAASVPATSVPATVAASVPATVAASVPVAAPAPAPVPVAAPVPAAAPVPVAAPAPVTAATVAAATLPTAEPSTSEFALLEQTCRSAYGRRRYRDVLDSCARAVDAKPAAGELAALVAEMEFDRGRMGPALTWARKAVAADPSVADAYVFIGGAEQQAGHADAARTAYMKYLELAPGGRYARDLRAIVKQ